MTELYIPGSPSREAVAQLDLRAVGGARRHELRGGSKFSRRHPDVGQRQRLVG